MVKNSYFIVNVNIFTENIDIFNKIIGKNVIFMKKVFWVHNLWMSSSSSLSISLMPVRDIEIMSWRQ